jgi:adenosylhomocysteinase
MNTEEFYWCIGKTLEMKPSLTLDDGADLIFTTHAKHPDLAKQITGGTEETTTGVHRLRAMAQDGKLLYPVFAVNDSETKWDFDNVYGTGQSSIDGILRATSILLAGKNFVVAGYGHCGRGVAMRAKGMGANVIITEVLPTAALRATLEGYRVMPMEEAAKIGDIFITATGMKDILVGRHFDTLKNGAVMCNTGHYDCEINIVDLEARTKSKREIRHSNEEYTLTDGRKVYLLAMGRLVNLAAAEGHPSEVMDMSFANQFNALLELHRSGKSYKPGVYVLPKQMDQDLARLKLRTMGLDIDTLTPEQVAYATDYSAGT